MIRTATIDDLPSLVNIGRDFCNESGWGWQYSEENAVRTFYTAICHPEMDVIVSVDNDKITGVSVVSIENDFTVDTLGDIVEFYVCKDARGSGTGRELLEGVCKWFDDNKCKNVFVKATGNIESQGKAFENLFKKYGFKVFSSVLVR